MKSIHHLILGFSVLLLVAACGPSRYTSSSFNLASVPEYAFIQLSPVLPSKPRGGA